MSRPETVAAVAAVVASCGGLARMPGRRSIRLAGLVALFAGWMGLVVAVAPAAVLDRWFIVVPALAVTLAVGWIVTRPLVGREQWLLAAGAAVVALRVPVPNGGDTSMLLAPLYVVVAVGTLVLLRRELAALRSPHAAPLRVDRGLGSWLLDVGSAALPALATMSLLWSVDRDASTQTLAFFLVPFLLVYALVRAWVRDERDLRPAAIALIGTTVVAAAVGLVQAATRTVWWNPKVVDANRYRPDFRTNSLFWDPNIYGRLLVIGLLALVATLLVRHHRRSHALAACAVSAIVLVALWNTYSQSSFFALAVALVALALLTLPPRPRRWAAAVVAAVCIAGVPIAADALRGDDLTGRADVARTGLEIARDRPLLGAGIGAFETAATREVDDRGQGGQLTASHTTPVTVLAELGGIGLLLYVALLAAAAAAALARWRATSAQAAAARTSGADSTATGWPSAPVVWATATVVALEAHSLLYAGFFEDASLWAALAVLASLPGAAGRDDRPGRD